MSSSETYKSMELAEYYNILGVPADSDPDEIKKAYRKKARLYHPDINHEPGAADKFIRLTEAYDFIVTYQNRIDQSDPDYDRIMEEWRKYRQDRSRQRANYYARTSYIRFKNSKYYKSTRILNSSSIIINFVIAILILIYTVFGYIFRIRHPLEGIKNPSVVTFILLLVFSLVLLVVSSIYLKAYIETRKKRKMRK